MSQLELAPWTAFETWLQKNVEAQNKKPLPSELKQQLKRVIESKKNPAPQQPE